MKLILRLALLLLPAPLVMAEALHGPHEHGTLSVAVTKQDAFLSFTMVASSQDIVGFEGSPKSAQQKKTLTEQYAKLYKEENLSALFRFEPAGACYPYSSNMESDMLTYHEHDDKATASEGPKDTHKVGDAKGHSDFELNYVFECDPVKRLQISFSEVFPSIKKVDFYGKGVVSGKVLRSVDASKAVVSGEDLN